MHNKTAFAELLKPKTPIILDGGLSNELEALGMDLNNPLWSASVLQNNPEAIVKAHLNYLNSGADIIITSSYQASVSGFKAVGVSEDQARKLITLSVSLAEKAVNEFMKDKPSGQRCPLVAASVGPYGATMADGSEYHGNYGLSDQALKEFHQGRLLLLDQTAADILACETIPSMQEAKILHGLLLDTSTPSWISLSCKDGAHANDGTAIEEIAALFVDHTKVLAIGINCTAPQYADELVSRIKKVAPEKAVIVYPNSGEHYDATDKTWHGTVDPTACAIAAKSWRSSGATLLGGCCRMGPDHISAMKEQCSK
tara:strand:- start:5091 stop:6029 length:939 start_codon:yes stop_codon:yes gene_type:complete